MGRVEALNRDMAAIRALDSVEIPSLEGKVDAAEWKLRVELAAAYRLVAYYGWDDLVFTHLSARIPGPEHPFLLNPYNLMFEEVTASSLVKVDVNGNPVDATPFITNPAGFTIHSAIHMAREDAHAVMHLHTPAGQAVWKNVGECFVLLYFLERACQAQVMALSAGDQLSNPPQGSPEITAQQGQVGVALAANLLAWPALKRQAYRLA